MNYFTFDGVDSRCFNTYIATSNAFDAPAQDVEVITVPGNNNIYYIGNDSYKPFDMVLYCYVPSDMQNKVDDLRNFLSHKGICRYIEAIKPDEFRYARFINAFELDVSDRVSAAFKLVFKAQPQRYLLANYPVELTATTNDTEAPKLNAREINSAYNGEPIITALTTGSIYFNGGTINITDAPVIINSQTMQCYYGTANMNSDVEIYDFPMIKKGVNEIGSTMDITILPNFWEL